MATRSETLIELINRNNYATVAEVGVGTGSTMERVLDACPQVTRYIAVDMDVGKARKLVGGRWPPGRFKFFEMDSVIAAKQIESESVDLVFLDADHSYESIKADIAAWQPKVHPGGILCGHDYWLGHSHPLPAVDGVKRAVDETFSGRFRLVGNGATHKHCYVWIVQL